MSASALRPTAAAAQTEWARRVAANREQAERLREEAPGDDFYAPVAPAFRADPARRDDPTLNALLDVARPDDTWLDVGAGGGRFSLGIARAVRRVIAVEPSPSMRAVFTQTITDFRDDEGGRIENTDLRDDRWPPASPDEYAADVAFISHVGYDVEAIGPFLDALEAAAARSCAAVLMDRAPPSSFSALWPAVHGEPQAELPGLVEFLALLLARGALPEVRVVTTQHWRFDSAAEAETVALRRLWLSPDGPKAAVLRDALARTLLPDGDGVRLPDRSRVGLVMWTPPGPGGDG
jgi:SAM-dependent methyltransferase